MKTVGPKDIAEALETTLRTVQRWAEQGLLPAPTERTVATTGRPEMRWAITALPIEINVKGKVVPVRARVAGKHIEALVTEPTSEALVTLDTPPLPKVVTLSSGQTQCTRRGMTRSTRERLNDADRAYRDGALVLCRAIEDAIGSTGCSAKTAYRELAERIVAGVARPELLAAAEATYVKRRASGNTESAQASRLSKMYALYLEGCQAGEASLFLVPGRREKDGFKPEDIAAFLRHYCLTSRPTVAKAWRDARAWYDAQGFRYPSYSVFTRLENELPVTIKYRGRMTGAEWRALKPYVDRDVSMFKSNDIWVGDGHTFKAKVQSPIHGQAFRPEITVIIDWVSRMIVGWSVALSESTIAVSDAFRHAQMTTRARPLIYYSDNGSGQTGKSIDCPIHGTLARQGIAHETGIPGNPQGRGIIERLWRTTTLPLAERYPTVLTKTADRDSIRIVGQILAKAERKGETSRLLPSWSQFMADLDAAVLDYNTGHKHRELGGLTPAEAYAAKLDKDSIVFGPDAAEIDELWRPEVKRTPSRCVFTLFNNTYFRRDLQDELAEGEEVRVRFDIHNADRVWLYRMDGTPIGEAIWDGNKKAAFPVPFVERKREERAAGIKARAQREINRADAELTQTLIAPPMDVVLDIPKPDVPAVDLDALLYAEEEKKPEGPGATVSMLDTSAWLYGDEVEEAMKNEDFRKAAG
ncbi:Mu transposase C-terminal domain-containing protein [Zoogloea sp.]|jgi:putative transposase|uniref:Mu transposase C-terminal domain-containing protein n=1 Tax=Zoogloea sp. TaxID=49181 RepID=UPI0037D9BE03